MAKGYRAGELCADYPNFIERLYEEGIISSPIISFYQLSDNDKPADDVESIAQVGGVDRNKYTATWTDSQWQVPYAQRFVSTADGSIVDAANEFVYTNMAFDTGASSLVGIPTDDIDTLARIAGAKKADDGGWRLRCDPTMTWAFHVTQNMKYTIALADAGSDDGSGFCSARPNDNGDASNWLAGAQFLDQYYVAHYFREKGLGSSMGFAQKNLDANAMKMVPVVGTA